MIFSKKSIPIYSTGSHDHSSLDVCDDDDMDLDLDGDNDLDLDPDDHDQDML